DEIGPRCSTGGPRHSYTLGGLPSQRSALTFCRFRSLAKQGVDLVAMHTEADEHTVIDHDGRHAESAQAIEQIEARIRVSPYVAQVDRRASRLKKRKRRLPVGVALHRKEQDLLHRASRYHPAA